TSADSLVRAAADLASSQYADSGQLPYYRAVELVRAIQHLADFYNAGLFNDSARFNRMIDHVAVTVEYVRGTIPAVGPVYYPRRTPQFRWFYYSGPGLHFQPISTVTPVLSSLRATAASTHPR